MVALTTDKKEIAPGDRVTITVTSNVEGSMKVDFPVDFEVDYGVMHGMEQKMDASGKIKTFYYMQQTGTFRKEGKYSFYANVNFKNTVYKSNKLCIKVNEEFAADISSVNSSEPVFGLIYCKKNTVYEGEAVLLLARVYSKYDIDFLEGYAPFEAEKSMESHVFQNGRQEVSETKINGKPALTFDYGKQLMIPVSTGKCKIKPFEMALRCQGNIFSKTVRFESAGTIINVKPLPSNAPSDFIGGVGTFQLEQSSPKKAIKQGEVFTLTLVISGVGNIHNCNTPILDLPKGCTIYGDPEREENIEFTEDGAVGEITYRFNIQVLNKQDLDFTAPSISYFSPEKERYITVKGESFTVEVIPDPSKAQLITKTPENNQHADPTVTVNVSDKKASNSGIKPSIIWGVGAPVGVLSLFFVFFLLRRKKETELHPEITDFSSLPPVFIEEQERITLIESDFWQDAKLAIEQPNDFAVLLPKAIIQRIEKNVKCRCTSRDKAFSELQDKHPEIAKGLRDVIDACDHYRYGFGSTDFDTVQLYKTTEELFKRIS